MFHCNKMFFYGHEAPTRAPAVWLPVLILLVALSMGAHVTGSDDVMKQRNELFKAFTSCNHQIGNTTKPTGGEVYCAPVWDNLMCWSFYVKAGTNVSQACPTYIQGFNPDEKAIRSCTIDGSWEIHPNDDINTSWTDFRNCLKKRKSKLPAIFKEHMPRVIQISTVGYSTSLGTLGVATAIMVFFKKLYCQRNAIHINLFISFMFRAIISLLMNFLLVRHLALPNDVKYLDDGSLVFIQEGTHWECKLLNTLWQYSLSANYMWIFVEGLYLHTLIFFAIFSQSTRFFKLYIVIGWVFPLVFIIVWVITRIYKNNTFCWNTHDQGFYWILNAPIVLSISVNFFFFLNIVRVLFTKIRDCNTRNPRRYRKLAKSTLVLIPMFGVYYIFFIMLDFHPEPVVTVVHMYLEITLNSFQGTVVALLFCFLNGEVQGEIRKRWNWHWMRRQSIVSGRSSRAVSTTSFYTGKERPSLTQGLPLGDIKVREDKTARPLCSPVSNNNNNGHVFHKVSSMPRLSLFTFPNMKPLPRVSSWSKALFTSQQFKTNETKNTFMLVTSEVPQEPESEPLHKPESEPLHEPESEPLHESETEKNTKKCLNKCQEDILTFLLTKQSHETNNEGSDNSPDNQREVMII